MGIVWGFGSLVVDLWVCGDAMAAKGGFLNLVRIREEKALIHHCIQVAMALGAA